MPVGTPAEKFLVTIREDNRGTITSNVSEAAEGDTVTLTVNAKHCYCVFSEVANNGFGL